MKIELPFKKRWLKGASAAVVLLGLVAGCGGGDAGNGAAAAGGDQCENYPEKPIEMIVPYAPGGGTDSIGRLIASIWPEYIDGGVRVSTQPGAGGAQGTQTVAQAEADGYTLSFGTMGSILTAGVLVDTGYTYEDFAPVGIVTEPSFVFVVGPDSPFKTLDELVAFSKENPGKVSYGSSGAGGSAHTMAAAAAKVLGVEWAHVPFDGSSEAVVAAAGGNVDFAVPSTGSTLEQIDSGLVNALAVTAAERVEGLDAPTFGELGHDFTFVIWRGVFAPAGTPDCRHP